MQFSLGKNLITALIIVVIIGGVFGLGYSMGERNTPAIDSVNELSNKEMGEPTQVDFTPFWQAWNILNQKYVGSSSPASQDKVWGAIQGLTTSYNDPYTVFFPPEESKAFESDINGNFEGVGMEIGIRDSALVVVSPLKDTPAYRAGVKAGDRILKIGDQVAVTLPVDKAVKLIRGKRGTSITLTLQREGVKEPFEITIVRDIIDIPTVNTELRKDGVFVIRLYNFSAPSFNLFRGALREFVESGSDKLILDLRNNPGGYLEAAVDIGSWFLPAGAIVVREDFGKNAPEQLHRSKGYNIFSDRLKFVVLVNGGSASASEILAGAMQAHKKATIVGEKTFGKGSVQELVKVTPETSLKITIARWLTPSGVSISNGGLTPDVEVKLTSDDAAKDKDPQLDKAVQILLNK